MDSQQNRNTVISVRVDGLSLQAIDLLVRSGLVQSRSEAVAQFVSLGIHSAGDLLEKANQLAENVQRVRGELMSAVKAREAAKADALLDRDPT
jgi:Arc/MetJ-type ribon-helix-helix transcriptional regulator